jgi:hypothetical protein
MMTSKLGFLMLIVDASLPNHHLMASNFHKSFQIMEGSGSQGNVDFHDDRFCALAAVFASPSYDFSAGVSDFTLVFPQLVACKAGSGWQMSLVGERAVHKVKLCHSRS